MIIQSVPSDEHGCGLYRTYMPSAACHVEVLADLPVQFDQDASGRISVTDAWTGLEGADVVNIHRPTTRHMFEALQILQSKGVAIVVDVDDDLQAIPRGIDVWDQAQPHQNEDENWGWVLKATQMADMVTVSTPALADRYGRHGRVAVIENCVAPDWLDTTPAKHETPVVGWAGSSVHHPYDLEEAGSEVVDAVRRHGARFHTVGQGQSLLRFGFTPDDDATWEPWVALDRYPSTISQFDLGLVPLADSQFTRAKSWLKGLELAALGVPFIASDRPEYRRLGAGLLAKRKLDWRRHLDRLLGSPDEREELAGRGREIAARWTVDKHAHRWMEAWEQGWHNRQTRRSAAA